MADNTGWEHYADAYIPKTVDPTPQDYKYHRYTTWMNTSTKKSFTLTSFEENNGVKTAVWTQDN